MNKIVCFAALTFLFLLFQPAGGRQNGSILQITIDGPINPVVAEYILSAIDRAEQENTNALIIHMDTPGGLLESTRLITKRMLAAKIPVIVYVAPTGARAASAGVFISYAAHLVAMAPSTNIGAAHPVQSVGMGGQDSTQTTMMEKVTNDAVAQVRGMAEKHGRNADWAEKAIRESVSITASEALELGVINFIVPTTDSLLSAIDGEKVKTESGEVTLQTRGRPVIEQPMTFRQRILYQLSNPNLAFILLMLGFYGLFFELYNPGSVFPGVIGAISMILFLYSMQVLPVNYAGLALIFVAIILFILEVKITSFGLLTVGGLISMIIGALMLFDSPDGLSSPFLQISLKIILTVAVASAAFFFFAFSLALRAWRSKVTTGKEGMIGESGIARSKIDPEGKVMVHGELWSAWADEKIARGERIKVIDVDGLRVKVTRAE